MEKTTGQLNFLTTASDNSSFECSILDAIQDPHTYFRTIMDINLTNVALHICPRCLQTNPT